MTAEAQLKSFIAKFDDANQALIRAVRKALCNRFPTAYELVYDNYNFFVIGYSPTKRPSDAVVSMTANANGVGLCFIHGAKLRDPHNLLRGSGKQTRSIRLPSAAVLSDANVEALIAQVIANANAPFAEEGRSQLIIRSVSEKQRPRKRLPKLTS